MEVDGGGSLAHCLALAPMRFGPRFAFPALPAVLVLLLAAATARAEEPGRVWRPVAQWYPDELEAPELAGIPADLDQSELRLHMGDDPRWAAPDFDDSDWALADRKDVLKKDIGIFWVRLRVRVAPGHFAPSGIFLGETAASDFYWDGALVKQLGRPGADRAHETAGVLYSLFELPGGALGPGVHVMALRLSTYRFNRPDPSMDLILLNVEAGRMAEFAMHHSLVPLLGVGAFLIIGVAAGLFWLVAERQRGVLLFAGLCLGGAATVFSVNFRHLFPPPYSWSFPIWAATEAVVALTAASLVALVLAQFPVRRSRWILAAFFAVEVVAAAHEVLAWHSIEPVKFMLACWRAAFLFSLVLMVHPAWRRRTGAIYVLAGLAVAAFYYERDPELFLLERYAVAMLPVLLGFVLAIGRTLGEERRQAREARLTAARMELELLRKSLQPHFLMNTLTALAQAIEENPRRAVRLIEDLADELRALARFAEEKEVTLARELDLCRVHLRVMSVRTEVAWELDAPGLDLAAPVPPALFFTLIENGFTHQQPVEGATRFRLRAEPVEGGLRYVFFSPGNVRAVPNRSQGGSGLRYVKARLNESWLGAWSFDQRAVAGGWETTIELRRRGGEVPAP
jgi:Histidine kinase